MGLLDDLNLQIRNVSAKTMIEAEAACGDQVLMRVVHIARACTFRDGEQVWPTIDDCLADDWQIVKTAAEQAMAQSGMLDGEADAGN